MRSIVRARAGRSQPSQHDIRLPYSRNLRIVLHHTGTLLRCAAAFRVHQVLLVGYANFNWQGSFGSHLHVDILVFPTWEVAVDYLRRGGKVTTVGNDGEQPRETSIVGIVGSIAGGDEVYSSRGLRLCQDECSPNYVKVIKTQSDSVSHNELGTTMPVHSRHFSGDVCFLMSKDKQGMPVSQATICHSFIHAPHSKFVPCDDGASLVDSATTLSIVLHHYTAWAGYDERSFSQSQKFDKEGKPSMRRRLCRVYQDPNEDLEDDGEPDEHMAIPNIFENSCTISDY